MKRIYLTVVLKNPIFLLFFGSGVMVGDRLAPTFSIGIRSGSQILL